MSALVAEHDGALRGYSFSDDEFERVRRLVHDQVGIALSPSKRELVYGRLSRRLRRLGIDSFAKYLVRLESDAAEMQQFCNAITTNLTSFFRERHHFEILARKLLPALERRNAASRRIRIWSAGCSTGEEPYSIAMVVAETLGRLPAWDIRILATDIDSNVLAHARRGLYERGRLEKLDAARITRWFEPQAEGGQYQVCDEIKRLITFNTLNFMSEWPLKGPFDVIFCRNVIIYFDRDTQRHVLRRMAALQGIGDHLILGHSESLLAVNDQYHVLGQTVHVKVRP
ncbi:MAG: CheR family methyltransferase [Steroidobacterales bacterium]